MNQLMQGFDLCTVCYLPSLSDFEPWLLWMGDRLNYIMPNGSLVNTLLKVDAATTSYRQENRFNRRWVVISIRC